MPRPGKAHQPNGLGQGAPGRTGHAGDRDRHAAAAVPQRAKRHFTRRFLAHRAVPFERRVKGGLGVMLDDVLAAGYTLVVLAIAKRALL